MSYHVVYLNPIGAGGFRAPLRSDTLWGSICWSIKFLEGDARLEKFLKSYSENPEEAVYISSAFPRKGKTHFFPNPLYKPTRQSVNTAKSNPLEAKEAARKLNKKGSKLIPQADFERVINGHNQLETKKESLPVIVQRPMTHNTIDRIKGATLSINGNGQLFHTEEIYLKGADTHFFFLLKGNLEAIKPALRFLEHYGIGGDRSSGKGRFDVSEPVPFELNTPKDANALVSLSLYHPTTAELTNWEQAQSSSLLSYELESRRGRTYMRKPVINEKALAYFKEGSVFPKLGSQEYYGENTFIGKHQMGFDIVRYGHGFMIPCKKNQPDGDAQ